VIFLQTTFIVLLIFFAIFGVADILNFFARKLFCSKKKEILNTDEAEFTIRSIATPQIWSNSRPISYLVCNYSLNSNETKKIIEIASREFDFIKFKKSAKIKKQNS
jgi:hypothetical protein